MCPNQMCWIIVLSHLSLSNTSENDGLHKRRRIEYTMEHIIGEKEEIFHEIRQLRVKFANQYSVFSK